jgi:class 3 adenylate cyclase/predicted ATPase
MRCSNCGAENPQGLKFCNECAAPFKRQCAKCGFDNAPTAKFCGDCAASLSASDSHHSQASAQAVRITAEADAQTIADGERKTVTALFADIKGSTELLRDLDPEEARAIIDPALKLMIDAVHRYDGYVVQSTGDGIFALFGAPVAHEDHPQRALHAAIATRDELRRRGEDQRTRGSAGVEVRIGINTGEVVMRMVQTGGHTEYSPVGHVINLASRMQSVAPPDGVVVSEETRRLVEGYFELRGLGPTEIKGVGEPIDVYEVVGVGALHGHFDLAARRGLTKFVGRAHELEQMQRTLELAMVGHGQIVAVVAEAGTGKSRLFYEFKRLIPQGCKVLEAYSVSHGKASAWLPVLELLRRYFVIQDTDDTATRREKVRGRLATLDAALSDTLPYLLVLLGIQETPDPIAQMDPQIKRQRTLDAIKRIVVRESLNQPLVLIFEDLHWIDEQTQALLDLLADSIANAHVLLLVNYRPEYRHEWTNKNHYVQLGLNPLGRENAEKLATALLGDAVELNPLKRLVVERTGGNPFFIEEMVQALFDEGALVRNGVVKVTRSLSQLRLPPTVHGILAARIDRLSAEQKELLQTMAVIGRESLLGLIRNMTAVPEAHLERTLAELRAAEFIYEQSALADTEYIFKHALTQEVAYNSLLIERRKLLHERAGKALESIFANQLDDHLPQLAHHYSHSDNLDKAVEYLGRSGQQALQRSAHTAAIGSLNAAISLLQRLPDSAERIQRELLLQLAAGPALIAVKGWTSPEVEGAYTHARELSEQLGDPSQLFPALFGLWVMHLLRGELPRAYDLAEQLLRRAQSMDDDPLMLYARYALGNASFWMGQLPCARENIETALSLYDRERHRPLTYRYLGLDARAASLSYAAWILWQLGYPDQALNRAQEALAAAQELSLPFTLAFTEFFVVVLHQYRREACVAQEIADSLIALCAEHGLTDYLAWGTAMRGWTIAEQQNETGIAQLREGLDALSATGTALTRPYLLCMLAEACMETDRLDDGMSALTDALAAADAREERNWEPEIHRLKGELLLRGDYLNDSQAQNCFQRAVEVARNQNAKSLELRATTSLARLMEKQGRRDEAHTMLVDIYSWFTEGFDTADLKDAKALLHELGI